MATPDEIFERVLSYCGFEGSLGPGVLSRALADGGVTKTSATVADYRRALPRLEARMRAYFAAEEVARRTRRIVGYLTFADGDLDFDDEQAFSKVGHNYEEMKKREAQRSGVTPRPFDATMAETPAGKRGASSGGGGGRGGDSSEK